MNNECPRCRGCAERGYHFCTACGRYLEDVYGGVRAETPDPARGESAPPQEKTQRSFLELILLTVCIVVMAVAAFEVITLMVHFPDISFTLSGVSLGFIVIVPFPHAIFFLGGFALQAYWMFIAMIILTCAMTVIRGLLNAIRNSEGATKPCAAEKTAAFWICVSLCAVYAANFIITFITLASGSEVEAPDLGSKLETMFLLADAAVWEEIVTRVLYIGVPMAAISFIATWKKESLRCLLGGFGMSKAAVALIILSGIIFGLAHYPGWEDQAWKVASAGIMGAFLGYIFVRFGLYASILLHFINNYLQSFEWMGAGGLTVIVSLLLLATGFIALIYILLRVLDSKESIAALPLFRNGYVKDE